MEITFSKLTKEQQLLFKNAQTKEISEFLGQNACRTCKDKAEEQEAWTSGRIMKARWVMNWKTIPEEDQAKALEDRKEQGNKSTINPQGTKKAKARLVILGFQHRTLEKENIKRHHQ